VEGEGADAKLTSLFLTDDGRPGSRINVEIIDFVPRTALEDITLEDCTEIGEVPGAWDVLRMFF